MNFKKTHMQLCALAAAFGMSVPAFAIVAGDEMCRFRTDCPPVYIPIQPMTSAANQINLPSPIAPDPVQPILALFSFGTHTHVSSYFGGECSDCGAPTTSGGNCTAGCT